ncbi:MAG: hypothetical protein RID91_11885 [Azospirillaceae bacterium]
MAIIINQHFDRHVDDDTWSGGDIVTSGVPEPVWILQQGADYGPPIGEVPGVSSLTWSIDETLMSRYTNSVTDTEPENDVVIEIGLYEFDNVYDGYYDDLEFFVEGNDVLSDVDFDHSYGSGEVRTGTENGIDYRIESVDIGSGYRGSYSDHYHEITLTVPSSFYAGENSFYFQITNYETGSSTYASWGISHVTIYEDNPVVPQYVLTDWASDFVDTRITTLDYNEGLGSLWDDYLQELEEITNVTDAMIQESAGYNFYDADGTQGYTTAHLEDQLVDGIGGVFDTFATGVGNGDSFDHFAEELWKAAELQDSPDSVTASLSSVQAFATMAAGVAEVAALGPEAGAVEILASHLTLDSGVLLVINDTIGKIIDSNPEDPNFVPDDLVGTVTNSLAGMEGIYHEALGTLDLYGEDGLADDLEGKYQAFADELSDFTKELTVMAVVDDLFRDKTSGFFGGETFKRHGEWKADYQYSAPGGDYGIPEVEVFEDLGLDVHVGYSGSGTHAKITVTETAETELSGISGFEYDAIVQFYGTPPKWIESEDFALIA